MGAGQSNSAAEGGNSEDKNYRVYVIVRYPSHDHTGANVSFSAQQLAALQTEIQKRIPEYGIILDVAKTQHYSSYTPAYNSDDPAKLIPKPRISVDGFIHVFRKGTRRYLLQELDNPYGSRIVSLETLEEVVKTVLDPSDNFFIDNRRRWNTSQCRELETLLRV